MKPPLAVDLDGTLIHGDLFTMWMARLARTESWKLPLLLFWLAHGRAYAKMRLAQLYPVDASTLDYNAPLLAWLRLQKSEGRTLALATACDMEAARAIAEHLNLFGRVFASQGRQNLKSRRKADALSAAFPDGFCYAGNEWADVPVWRRAKAAIVVNASPALARAAREICPIEAEFPRPKG